MVNSLYDFWKKELAAVYLEALKPVMKGNDAKKKEAALNTLYICLDYGLKMLHPSMPFITEELFQRLPHDPATVPESICIAPWPTQCPSYEKENIEEQMGQLLDTISAFRSQLAALGVASNAKPTIAVQSGTPELHKMFLSQKDVIEALVKSGETNIIPKDGAEPEGSLKGFVAADISIYVKVIGLIDVKLEIARIAKQNGKLQDLATKLQAKMEAKSYADRVPDKVKAEDAAKLARYQAEIAEMDKQAGILAKFA